MQKPGIFGVIVCLKKAMSGKGEYYIERDLAQLFKISEEQSKKLLQEPPKPIKENLSLEKATKYEEAIKNTGAKCSVESMQFDIDGLSLE